MFLTTKYVLPGGRTEKHSDNGLSSGQGDGPLLLGAVRF
jgi:hypothetical protein